MAETEIAAVAASAETAPATEKAVDQKPARKKIKFFAHYEPAELSQMEQLYTSTLNQINQDEIVKGRIVSISNKDVTIDVGYKSEGIVSLLEFRDEDEIQVGDDVEVYLENIEDKMGQLILSKKKADVLRIWDKIYDSIENDTIISGKIINRVKGGMTVSLSGVEAFLPGSQIDVKPVRDFDALVGQTMDFRVVKINPVTQNIVVSHKVILEEEYAARREEMLDSIKVGMVLEVRSRISLISASLSTSAVSTVLFISQTSPGAESIILPRLLTSTSQSRLLLSALTKTPRGFRWA